MQHPPLAPTIGTTEIDERIKELSLELKMSKTPKHKSEVKRMIDYWLDQRLSESKAC